MRDDELQAIAEMWWNGVARQDWNKTEAVDDIVESAPHSIPALIAALVLAAPEVGPQYIGTSLLENLHYQAEHDGVTDSGLEYLKGAGLTEEQMTAVLSGVYPDMLVEWGIADVMASTLTEDQIAWLTDSAAPNRRDYL